MIEILYLFLYFPEDKSEYIPAVIELIIFVIGAVFFMKFIRRISNKEKQKFEQQFPEHQVNKDESQGKNE